MGLTIHYEFRLPGDKTHQEALAFVEALHAHSLDLPCASVSEIFKYESPLDGPEIRFDELGPGDAELFGHLAMQFAKDPAALAFLMQEAEKVPSKYSCVPDPEERKKLTESMPGVAIYENVRAFTAMVMPARGYMFFVNPGEGSESLAVGLGSYPAKLGSADTASGSDWWWQKFCKIHYAGNVSRKHFLSCYLSVVSIFDKAADLGINLDINDDTEFWEHRDEERLLSKLDKANRSMAAFAGMVKDSLDPDGTGENGIKGAIFSHPDFEKLEAEGNESQDGTPGRKTAKP